VSSGPEFLTGIKDGNRVSREVAVIPAVIPAVVAAVAAVAAAAVEEIADTKPASRGLSASSRKALKKMAGL
jgi:hypothetical protein